jgi:hypothetical protein
MLFYGFQEHIDWNPSENTFSVGKVIAKILAPLPQLRDRFAGKPKFHRNPWADVIPRFAVMIGTCLNRQLETIAADQRRDLFVTQPADNCQFPLPSYIS